MSSRKHPSNPVTRDVARRSANQASDGLRREAAARGHEGATVGAGVGAALGAMVGSFLGPPGAIIGGAIGAGLGGSIGNDIDREGR